MAAITVPTRDSRANFEIITTTDLTESLASVAEPADAHFDLEEMRPTSRKCC